MSFDWNESLLQFTITFILFYSEAIIHYNIGKTNAFGFTIPPLKHQGMMISTVFIFFLLSSIITNMLEEYWSL
jgi:tetrahydromethanopterin S-methyltransferase subunit D